MSNVSSVTNWIARLKAGDTEAAQFLWERYYFRLVQLAKQHLSRNVRQAADEEDVALDAMASFYQGVEQGRFPRLDDRHDLWRLLLTITIRKARDLANHETRQRRGQGEVRSASELFQDADADLDRLANADPTPAMAAMVTDQIRHLLDILPGEDLRQVARLKLEGLSVPELATALAKGRRTIERKLNLIRQIWRDFLNAADLEFP